MVMSKNDMKEFLYAKYIAEFYGIPHKERLIFSYNNQSPTTNGLYFPSGWKIFKNNYDGIGYFIKEDTIVFSYDFAQEYLNDKVTDILRSFGEKIGIVNFYQMSNSLLKDVMEFCVPEFKVNIVEHTFTRKFEMKHIDTGITSVYAVGVGK